MYCLRLAKFLKRNSITRLLILCLADPYLHITTDGNGLKNPAFVFWVIVAAYTVTFKFMDRITPKLMINYKTWMENINTKRPFSFVSTDCSRWTWKICAELFKKYKAWGSSFKGLLSFKNSANGVKLYWNGVMTVTISW